MGSYDRLFAPIQISKGLKSKNRIMKAPQSTWFFEDDFTAGDRVINFYESIAKGGAGITVVSAVAWTPLNPGGQYGGMFDDKFIPSMSKLAGTIKKHGSLAICQFHHGGPSAPADYDGGAPVGSSTLPKDELPAPGAAPRGVSIEEMQEYKRRFVAAAVRVKEAGFDALEFHVAHGYFFESFISKVWNRREDEYGPQNMENRLRYVLEIMAALKEELGDFPVGVRMNGQEWGAKGAITIEEACEVAKAMEKAGVEYISVTGFGFGSRPFRYLPDYWPYPEPELHMKRYMNDFKGQGLLVPSAAAIKKAVSVPVAVAGRMDEDKAEEILSQGKADIIAFGRFIWADPEFPNKLQSGNREDITRCTRCATCEDPPFGQPRRCRVNPAMGKEAELAIIPAKTPKRVIVIGGGPSGMEAARVAMLRGHNVTLYEKSGRLGGLLPLAAMIKGTEVEDVRTIVDYLTTQVKKLNIPVKYNTTVTKGIIDSVKPDVVLIATGGLYSLPEYTGINKSVVKSVGSLSKQVKVPLQIFGPEALSKLTHMFLPLGKNVVVIGGQIEGCQGAVFMRKRGRNVTIIEPTDKIGTGIPPRYMERLLPWMEQKGIQILKSATVQEITDEGVIIKNAEGHTYLKEADTVMVLMPQQPNNQLLNALEGSAYEVRRIGSANGAEVGSLIVNALADGRKAGCEI